MCVDVDDPVEVLHDKVVTARKEHRCDECFSTIQPSTRYRYEAYVYEGDFTAHKTCRVCMQAREWIDEVCHGAFYYGDVLNEVAEHWSEELLRGLSFGRLVLNCSRLPKSKRRLLTDQQMREAIASGGAERRAA